MFTFIESFAGPMPWIGICIALAMFTTFVIGTSVKYHHRIRRERKVSRLNARARMALEGFDDDTVPRNIWD